MKRYYHYIFSTYKRKQMLVSPISTDLRCKFMDIAAEKGYEIVKVSILVDHVHLLIGKNQYDSNEYVMKTLKGISSNYIFKKYPSNRYLFRKLWGRGYRAYEIADEDQFNAVMHYIDNQTIQGVDKRCIVSRDV